MSDKLYKVKINDKQELQILFDADGKISSLDNKAAEWNIVSINKGPTPTFHIIKDKKSFTAEVI